MKQFMFKQDLAQVYFEGYDQEVLVRALNPMRLRK